MHRKRKWEKRNSSHQINQFNNSYKEEEKNVSVAAYFHARNDPLNLKNCNISFRRQNCQSNILRNLTGNCLLCINWNAGLRKQEESITVSREGVTKLMG